MYFEEKVVTERFDERSVFFWHNKENQKTVCIKKLSKWESTLACHLTNQIRKWNTVSINSNIRVLVLHPCYQNGAQVTTFSKQNKKIKIKTRSQTYLLLPHLLMILLEFQCHILWARPSPGGCPQASHPPWGAIWTPWGPWPLGGTTLGVGNH